MEQISRANIGAYGVSEAARFAKVPETTARRWIRGYARDKYAPVLRTDLPPVDGRWALSFLDLVDLLVVGRFRDAGVPLQSIRRAYAWLGQVLGTPHPFSHATLLTDGITVFLKMYAGGESQASNPDDERLIEVVTGQNAMPQLLRPYLTQIDYQPETKHAMRWRIANGVVLDPRLSFGKPTLESVGTTTFVLASAFWANDRNAALVADLFDVSQEAVRQAVSFEQEFSGHRAA